MSIFAKSVKHTFFMAKSAFINSAYKGMMTGGDMTGMPGAVVGSVVGLVPGAVVEIAACAAGKGDWSSSRGLSIGEEVIRGCGKIAGGITALPGMFIGGAIGIWATPLTFYANYSRLTALSSENRLNDIDSSIKYIDNLMDKNQIAKIVDEIKTEVIETYSTKSHWNQSKSSKDLYGKLKNEKKSAVQKWNAIKTYLQTTDSGSIRYNDGKTLFQLLSSAILIYRFKHSEFVHVNAKGRKINPRRTVVSSEA